MFIKKICILMSIVTMLLVLSSNSTAMRSEIEVKNETYVVSSLPSPTTAGFQMTNVSQILTSADNSAHEPNPDIEIDYDTFNETPHKGNLFNGIPYEYIGLTEPRISGIFKTLIDSDFDNSNLETKTQYVDTPQKAAQIVSVLTEYRQNYDRFFYAVSLDEENNCWVVEHRFYLHIRPDGGNTSYFLISRNDSKIIVIEYMGAYFRMDKPDQEEIIANSPGFLFGLSDWAFEEVNSLYRRDVIPRLLQYYFQNPTYRHEFAALIVNVYESILGPVTTYNSPFIDISNISYDLRTSVEKAYTIGLINGTSADRFSPRDLLSREQTAKILCTLVSKIEGILPGSAELPDYLDATDISDWALASVAFVQENDIMIGSSTGRFNPRDNLTCEEALVIVERLIAQYGW